jgi:hypothetical protein
LLNLRVEALGCRASPCSSGTVALARRSAYDVTRTSTDIPAKALVAPTKLPDTGIACRMSRTTATGIRLQPPMLRFVESKLIQPAPGTKISAQACVDPAPLDPTPC